MYLGVTWLQKMRKQDQATKPSTPPKYRVKGAKRVKSYNPKTKQDEINYYGFITPEHTTTPVFIQGENPSTLNGANLLTELNYKHTLRPTPPSNLKQYLIKHPLKAHVTKHTTKNPFFNMFGVLSYKEINELKTLKLRGGYTTKHQAKLYTVHKFSYRYQAHTKTTKPKTINTPPTKYAKGFIPIGSKLLFRCPICNQTKTKFFKNREISTPTHTHEIKNPSINPLNCLFEPTIKSTVNLYLTKLSIKPKDKEIIIYDISQKQDTPSIIILEDKPEPKPSTNTHQAPRRLKKTPPPIDTPNTISLKRLNQKSRGGKTTKTNTIKRIGYYHQAPHQEQPSITYWGFKP